MFVTRLLSGILLMVIALVTLITGGNLLFFVLLLISLIGMTELYKVFGIEKKPPGIRKNRRGSSDISPRRPTTAFCILRRSSRAIS